MLNTDQELVDLDQQEHLKVIKSMSRNGHSNV